MNDLRKQRILEKLAFSDLGLRAEEIYKFELMASKHFPKLSDSDSGRFNQEYHKRLGDISAGRIKTRAQLESAMAPFKQAAAGKPFKLKETPLDPNSTYGAFLRMQRDKMKAKK